MVTADCPFFIRIYRDIGLCDGTIRPRKCGGILEYIPNEESIYKDFLCGKTGLVVRVQDRVDSMSGRPEKEYQVVGHKGKKEEGK